jgi:hypothetical protein
MVSPLVYFLDAGVSQQSKKPSIQAATSEDKKSSKHSTHQNLPANSTKNYHLLLIFDF